MDKLNKPHDVRVGGDATGSDTGTIAGTGTGAIAGTGTGAVTGAGVGTCDMTVVSSNRV